MLREKSHTVSKLVSFITYIHISLKQRNKDSPPPNSISNIEVAKDPNYKEPHRRRPNVCSNQYVCEKVRLKVLTTIFIIGRKALA